MIQKISIIGTLLLSANLFIAYWLWKIKGDIFFGLPDPGHGKAITLCMFFALLGTGLFLIFQKRKLKR